MKKINVALTILMALGLAACGSSDSHLPNNKPAPNTEVGGAPTSSNTTQTGGSVQTDRDTSSNDADRLPQNDDKKEELPQEKTAYTQNSPTIGGLFSIPKNDETIKTGHITSPDTELTTFLNVEGKQIPLSKPGLNGNKININNADSTLMVQKGTNTLIAFVQQNDLNNRYLFNANINQTKNMPTEGTLTYKGQSFSLYAKDDKAGKLDTIDDNGLVEFTADFNQKTLTGTIKSSVENSDFEPVEISASITQNTFSGSKNHVSVQGGFFGENAGELAGDYIRSGNDQQNAIGVFRAEKSK